MSSVDIDIETMSYNCVKEYSHYITKSRVLPHLDLKPVQRRLLWSMIGLKARSGKGRYLKSSTIVGHTLKYHPHGEGSVYTAMCNLINMPNPLVEGRGNFGGIYGDSPASSRYTEARTSELFEHIIDDYAFELGEFIANYDESDKEPILFQTKIPIALLTGCNGIGIGLTTTSPSFHIDYIKKAVKDTLDGIPVGTMDYAYGGVLLNNKIYPDFKISKKNNKDYLHITSMPIGSSAKIFNSSTTLTELVSNKIIEIIDESTCDTVSIYIKAPQDIQDMILDSMSQPIIHNFRYYWKKLRSSGYIETWLEERKKFVEKRENYKLSHEFLKELTKHILSGLSEFEGKLDSSVAEDFANKEYDKYYSDISDKIKVFLPKPEDFAKVIISKPISMIKKQTSNIPVLKDIVDQDIIDIIKAEVDSIDVKLFSPKTKPGSAVVYATFDTKIKRYIALRDNSVEIKYNKISRVVNWETESNPIIIYNDGSTESISPYFFGVKTDSVKKVVGFTLHGNPTVVITESNKIKVLTRLGYINEPIKSAFPAKKMLINDKEYLIQRGLELSDVKTWKILEV